MTNKEVERIVWVDPNLKTNFGHPIEGVCSVNNYVNNTRGLCMEIVSNEESDDSIQRLLENVYPIITNTCFQNLDNEGLTFHENMEEINDKLKLNVNDLVIIPTAYSNEILGVGTFLEKHKNTKPKIALQIHQFFPPTQTFKQTLEESYFLINKKYLSKALNKVSDFKNTISIWTTQAQNLNHLLNTISPINIGMLPLPVEFHKEFMSRERSKNTEFTISFLGDGRYEKGLLIFMEAIKNLNSSNVKIIIQDYNSRGYGDQESNQLEETRKQLKSDRRIEFIEKAIDPVNFQKLISDSDVVVMPYNPLSYDKRVSEIYIIARMYNQTCVVSSGTWMADEAYKYNTGIVFDYRLDETKQTIDNLRKELEIITKERLFVRVEPDKQAEYYKKVHNPKNVINQLINHYE